MMPWLQVGLAATGGQGCSASRYSARPVAGAMQWPSAAVCTETCDCDCELDKEAMLPSPRVIFDAGWAAPHPKSLQTPAVVADAGGWWARYCPWLLGWLLLVGSAAAFGAALSGASRASSPTRCISNIPIRYLKSEIQFRNPSPPQPLQIITNIIHIVFVVLSCTCTK